MPKFKLLTQPNKDNIAQAIYLGDVLSFSFSRQSADGHQLFDLLPNSKVELDLTALNMKWDDVDVIFDCIGSWMNYTKKNPPELIYCVTALGEY